MAEETKTAAQNAEEVIEQEAEDAANEEAVNEEAVNENEQEQAEDQIKDAVDTAEETEENSGDCQAAQGAEADAAVKTDAAEEKEKKDGLFKKKKKSKEQEKIEELTDQVKRQMAEFDNFRKRTEKEKTQMFETGARSIIEKLLPVVDNFERGIGALSEEERTMPFAEGMEKVYKQILTMFEEVGVKPIEAQGKEFDPNLHNAVMHIEDESLGENVVAQELQKGYLYHDTVVRHSMVQVAN